MKKGSFVLAAALCATIVFADTATMAASSEAGSGRPRRRGNWKPTPEELAQEDEEYNRATGGQIWVAPSGPAIWIFDCRTTPTTNAPERVSAVLGSMYRFPATNVVATLEKDVNALAEAEAWRRREKALMAILLVDGDGSAPSLTVCPEERIAVVNCKKATQFTKGNDADVRLIKEIWRAVGFISGAGFSKNDTSVMQPVGSPLELDAVEWQVIHPMAYQNMAGFINKYGVKRGHSVTYRQAVEEGWAPPPTNDYQRAIWDATKGTAATNWSEKAEEQAR